MKKNVVFIAMLLFVAVVITSCGEASKKEAQEANKELKKLDEVTKADIKNNVTQSWQKFQKESDTLLKKSENEITDLKDKIAKSSKKEQEKLNKELDKLVIKNNELKQKVEQRAKEFKEGMIAFDEKAEEKEKSFEREFKHDMDELGTTIKDFFKDNVK